MTERCVSIIVAISENGVIGKQGDLPWRMSADLKRFRKLTTGHHIILGRKTFESIGRLLPERTTVIVTRNRDFSFPGAKMAMSLQQAIDLCGNDDQPFVAGGAGIYQSALPLALKLYLTRVHCSVEGDVHFPPVDWSQWQMIDSEQHPADERNEHDYSFEVYQRTRSIVR